MKRITIFLLLLFLCACNSNGANSNINSNKSNELDTELVYNYVYHNNFFSDKRDDFTLLSKKELLDLVESSRFYYCQGYEVVDLKEKISSSDNDPHGVGIKYTYRIGDGNEIKLQAEKENVNFLGVDNKKMLSTGIIVTEEYFPSSKDKYDEPTMLDYNCVSKINDDVYALYDCGLSGFFNGSDYEWHNIDDYHFKNGTKFKCLIINKEYFDNDIKENWDYSIIGRAYDYLGDDSNKKCHHEGCNKNIVENGDSIYCEEHSNKCANCGKYIDEDAFYCIECMEKALYH